jgi:hypothetical protein
MGNMENIKHEDLGELHVPVHVVGQVGEVQAKVGLNISPAGPAE